MSFLLDNKKNELDSIYYNNSNIVFNIEEMDLTKLSKIQLLEKCEELGIQKCKSKNKNKIIELINNKFNNKPNDKPNENPNDEPNYNLNGEPNDNFQDKQININNYYIGDNIALLQELNCETIDLIYFDPPYNTGRNFYDFDDKFKNKEEYIQFIKDRINECHRVLKKTGTLVIHIEPKISHYFRIMCDEIFGDNNFRNEIVWQTGGNAKNKYKLNRFHDTIIVYSKTNNQIFNPIYFNYDEEYKKKSNVKFCHIHKKEYVTTAIYNAQPDVNPRLNLRYLWNDHFKQWYVTKDKMEKLHEDQRLEYNKEGIPRIKRFLDEMEGVPLRDIWTDINNVQSSEKINYATQKPVKLLERIVKLYSNENDLCLDIFAGSGTTGRACINTNRKYLLFDINEKGKKIFLESINK
jgi:site-specific DNA-methyltransferase (adenine-specific)/adenine-specific DNA-methyltransferase